MSASQGTEQTEQHKIVCDEKVWLRLYVPKWSEDEEEEEEVEEEKNHSSL